MGQALRQTNSLRVAAQHTEEPLRGTAMVLIVTGPGRYIALEGAEACGKSTHAVRLADDLGAVLTRETGGTRIGAAIREILHDTDNHELSDHAEVLLIAADRAQHLAEVIRPSLAQGRHVVSDRSAYSSLAYQGYGRGVPIDVVRSTSDWALDGTWPELVLLIDVPPEILAQRMSSRDLDRFEQADAAFHDRVRAGFATMAAADPQHWLVIDGTGSMDDVAAIIRSTVRDRLGI
ncbi:MAG: tmk [Ilumatobacteraceae bacterium]|nr:tmk [Ilumatobacteraceae bacterium]